MKQLITDFEHLNALAPYAVEHQGCNFYTFTTNKGAAYQIGFLAGIYMGENKCHHLILKMDRPITSIRNFIDAKASKTVSVILEQLFTENPTDVLIFPVKEAKDEA